MVNNIDFLLNAANKVVLEVLEYAGKQGWGSAEIVAHFPSLAHFDVVRKTIEADGLSFTELVSQPYQNCEFSAGLVEGHSVDVLYLKVDRDGATDVFLILRPDEMAAIAYCASGALWSHLEEQVRVAR